MCISVWTIVELFFSVVGIFNTGLLALGIFKEKRNRPLLLKAILLIIIFIFVNAIIESNTFPTEYHLALHLILNVLVIIAATLVICKIKVYWAILFGICTYLFMEAMGLLFTAISVLLPIDNSLFAEPSRYKIIWFTIFHVLIFLIFAFIVWIRKRISEKTQLKIAFALLIFSVLTFIMTLYIDFEPLNSYFQEYIMSFSILFTIIIGIIVFILVVSVMQHSLKDKQLIMAKELLAIQKEHISQMAQKQAQIQQMSHDFKQHIHTLQGLNDSGDHDNITETLRKLSQQQLNSVRIVSTGNATIDALLSIKKEIAEREDILCDWQIIIPPNLAINELDTCVALGNALDNAIEACRKYSIEQPIIKLYMYCEHNWVLCGITNPIGQRPQVEKGTFLTLKPDAENHGLGLQGMKQCCENMGGNLEVFYDEDKFTIRFMLPLNNVD